MKTLLEVKEDIVSFTKARQEIEQEDPDSESAKAILEKNELKTGFNKNGNTKTRCIIKTTGINGESNDRKSDK